MGLAHSAGASMSHCSLLFAVAVLVGVALSFSPTPADAAQPLVLDRDIAGELTLPKTRKPHRVTRNITVRPTATLRIERGAEIAVDPGVWITLMAGVGAIGEGDYRAVFGPSNRAAGWSGLMIAKDADITLSGLTIVGAECGIWNWSKRNQYPKSRVVVQDTVVTNCKTGVRLAHTGGGKDTFNEFTNCVVADCREDGFHMQYYGGLKLVGCTVLRCGRYGVHLADLNRAETTNTVFARNDIGLATKSRKTPVTITSSVFVASVKGHIDHEVGDEMSARGNWWGTADPRLIARSIQDGRDLPGRGQVDARDFLTEAPENAGASLQP